MSPSPYQSNWVTANGIRLHYLDWGGDGPVLLFLAGMGCNAYIFARLAPRFSDRFHAIAMTRRGHGDSEHPESGYDIDSLTEDIRQFMDALDIEQAVLVGHSMAGVELSHLAALYPERVRGLVFLDAAYDRSAPEYKAHMAQNPLRKIPIPGADDDYTTAEDYIAFFKRAYPVMAAIWDEFVETEILHEITTGPDGRIVDRMSPAISQAIEETLATYTPEDAQIQAPVLSFYALLNPSLYVASDYMTPEQQAQVVEFLTAVRLPFIRQHIEQFRRNVPHARIVEIPNGHHYCFIQQEELIVDEMERFLGEIE